MCKPEHETNRHASLDQTAEITKLKEENQRLKNTINALMYGYNTLCEVNLQTGRVSFFKLGSPIFAQLGMRGGNCRPLTS